MCLVLRERRELTLKKIIALRGVANRGKSCTLKKVYHLLIEKYPDCNIEYLKDRVDIRAVLTVNDVKIGLESQGDPGSRLFKSLKLFVTLECQIIICATRSRGATVDAVNNLEGTYEILWHNQIEESSEAMREERDCKMAQKIISQAV